jgi:hypothetical protein
VTRHIFIEDRMDTGEDVRTHLLRIRLPPLDTLIATMLVVFVVSCRAWAALQWTFQGDDWTYVANAVQLPFLRFITLQHAGHLLPGQFALVWMVSRAAPLNYAVAVAPLLVLALVGGLLMWRFLEALYHRASGGRRR